MALLVLDDSNMLPLAAAVDPMRAANRLAARRMFDWTYLTATARPARLTSGIEVPGTPIARAEPCDLLLVIAGFNLEAQATPPSSPACAGSPPPARRSAGSTAAPPSSPAPACSTATARRRIGRISRASPPASPPSPRCATASTSMAPA
ncbi:hypothetical protein ACFSZS_06610 [Seohaeicola zhoushanensis]